MKNYKVIIALFIIYFVFAALLNSVGILVERSIDVYKVNKDTAALLEPFKDLSIAIVSFLVGSFLPRIGFKKGLLISLAAVFLGCLIMYYGNSFNTTKILFALTGMSFAIVKVTVFSLMGYLTDSKKSHSQLMGLTETVFMLGIIFMYVVFPLFYNDNIPNAWLNGYLFMAGLIGIAFLIIVFTKIDIKDENSPTNLHESLQVMGGLLTKNLTIWIFALFGFFYVMTEQGIMSWLPTFNKETLHLNPTLSAQVSVLLMTSIALGRFLSSFLVKKIAWYFICLSCIIGAAILVLTVLPMAKNVTSYTITSIKDLPAVSYLFPLIGLFLAPLYPLVNSTVLSNVAQSKHSALAGILTFFSAIGGTVGSLTIGKMFDVLGGNMVFYLSLIPLTILFGTIIWLQVLTSRNSEIS